MGKKGVMRGYVTPVGYASPWLIHHVYKCDGYLLRVCMLIVLLYLSYEQIFINRLYLSINK